MVRNAKLTISGTDRQKIREEVVHAFLKEEPGAGTGELCSIYLYEVEQLVDGKTIFLKRPAMKNKGFDFAIHVSDTNFGGKRNPTMPRHEHILADLEKKQTENPTEFAKVLGIIRRLYNCEHVPCEDMRALKFTAGFPCEMMLKATKWLFIEQDVTYWNFSGRNKFYSGIQSSLS